MNRRALLLTLPLLASCGPKPAATAAKPVAAATAVAAATPAAAPSPTPETTPIEPDVPFPSADAFRDKQPAPGPTP